MFNTLNIQTVRLDAQEVVSIATVSAQGIYCIDVTKFTQDTIKSRFPVS